MCHASGAEEHPRRAKGKPKAHSRPQERKASGAEEHPRRAKGPLEQLELAHIRVDAFEGEGVGILPACGTDVGRVALVERRALGRVVGLDRLPPG